MLIVKWPRKGAKLFFRSTGIGGDGCGLLCCRAQDYEYRSYNVSQFKQPKSISDQFGNKPVEHWHVDGIIDLTYYIPELSYSQPSQCNEDGIYYRSVYFNNQPIRGSSSYRYPFKVAYLNSALRTSPYVFSSLTSTSYCYSVINSEEYINRYLTDIRVSDDEKEIIFHDSYIHWCKIGHSGKYGVGTSWENDSSGFCYEVGTTIGLTASNIAKLVNLPSVALPSGDLTPEVSDSLMQDVMDKVFVPQVNNWENLESLKDIKENIPPILDIIKKHNIKSLSELYLWYKYSYSTTKLDLQAYMKYIASIMTCTNNEYQRVSSSLWTRKGTWTKNTRYHTYFSTYNASVLEALGLRFTTENLWDIVPFSFVVDWFINLGDLFKKIDNWSFISKLHVLSVVTSCRVTETVDIPGFNHLASWSIRKTYYTRSLSKDLPVTEPIVSLKNPSRHIVDGAALVIANKRR